MTRLKTAALTLLLALLPAALAQPNPPKPPSAAPAVTAAATQMILERGRSLNASFYAVDLDKVWAVFTQDVKDAYGGLDAFRAFRRQGVEDYGAEAKLLDEEVVPVEGALVYVRTATFVKQPTLAWSLVWAFDAKGQVVYFTIEYAGTLPPTPSA